MTQRKKFVYGTATKKWYLVGKADRDYKHGITRTEMKNLGKTKAKKKYLRGRII